MVSNQSVEVVWVLSQLRRVGGEQVTEQFQRRLIGDDRLWELIGA